MQCGLAKPIWRRSSGHMGLYAGTWPVFAQFSHAGSQANLRYGPGSWNELNCDRLVDEVQ